MHYSLSPHEILLSGHAVTRKNIRMNQDNAPVLNRALAQNWDLPKRDILIELVDGSNVDKDQRTTASQPELVSDEDAVACTPFLSMMEQSGQ